VWHCKEICAYHAGKWGAAVTEIKLYQKEGRPILVGTTSVERSEALAAMLQQEGTRLLAICLQLNVNGDAMVIVRSTMQERLPML
jgi:preprotein translocase subunit SecA